MNRTPAKDIAVGLVSLVALFYLMNPTAGFLELLPDVLPMVGNLDEATATLILVSALRYFFNVDLGGIFQRGGTGGPRVVDEPKRKRDSEFE